MRVWHPLRWTIVSLVLGGTSVSACDRSQSLPHADYASLAGAGTGDGTVPFPYEEPREREPSTGGAPAAGGASGSPVMEGPSIGQLLSREPHVFPPLCQTPVGCVAGAVCRQGWCAPSTCGDGSQDIGEECDDGNTTHSDGCELDCTETRILDIASSTSACALLSSGAVKCWGLDERGVLAQGTVGAPIVDPAAAAPLNFGTTRRVTRITAGDDTFCVIFERGKARCWGANDKGQLGIGTTDDYGDEPGETLASLPDLPFDEVLQIAPGREHTCALVWQSASHKKEVRCWGDSESGQRGDGFSGTLTDAQQSEAVNLSFVEPIQISSTGLSSCLLFEPGRVICWGNNSVNGLSGNGSTWAPNFETEVLDLLGNAVQHLAVRTVGSNCTFEPPNTIYCWGSNSYGQLGTPYLIDNNVRTPVPIQVGDIDFVDLQSGSMEKCGLTREGHVYCFGQGEKLPYASQYDSSQHPKANWASLPNEGAVDVGDFDGKPGIDPVVFLFVSRTSTCVQMLDRSFRCWGTNTGGLLGYGFDEENGPDLVSRWSRIGDDETPAEAYERLGDPAIVLY